MPALALVVVVEQYQPGRVACFRGLFLAGGDIAVGPAREERTGLEWRFEVTLLEKEIDTVGIRIVVGLGVADDRPANLQHSDRVFAFRIILAGFPTRVSYLLIVSSRTAT